MTSFDQLSQIIPEDQALANKALAVSMKGIINIKKIQTAIVCQYSCQYTNHIWTRINQC